MEIYCADCGCLVERGVRIIPCATEGCCCLHLPTASPMETIAARIRTACNAHDMDAFRALISTDGTWGDDMDSESACKNRDDIIRTYEQLLNEGVRGTVIETTTGPRGVACLVEVEWPDPEDRDSDPRSYQVFLVADGLVTKIEGHDDRDAALVAISH